MTPSQQRIAIAKVGGWERAKNLVGDEVFVCGDLCRFEHRLPDYLNDLNAMHDAEKVLTPEQLPAYECELCEVVAEIDNDSWIAVVRATATQRAEAFLRTLNLWTE